MKIVISGADHEVNSLFNGKEVSRIFQQRKPVPIIINGVTTDFVLTQYTETPKKDGLFHGFNVELIFESLVYVRKSKEELQAQEAVNKAKDSLKAAEDTLKAVKEKK